MYIAPRLASKGFQGSQVTGKSLFAFGNLGVRQHATGTVLAREKNTCCGFEFLHIGDGIRQIAAADDKSVLRQQQSMAGGSGQGRVPRTMMGHQGQLTDAHQIIGRQRLTSVYGCNNVYVIVFVIKQE